MVTKELKDYWSGYNQGRLKALQEVQEMILKEKKNKHNSDCIICWNLVEEFNQEIERLKHE